MRWATVLFDLDDTLFDERQYVLSGFRAVAHSIAPRWKTEEATLYQHLARKHNEGVRGSTFNQLCLEYGEDEAWVPVMVDAYRQHLPQIALRPEAIALLRALREAGARLGVVSDGPLVMQQSKVTALGVAPLVDTIVLSDALGREYWKPHAMPYLEALAQLDSAPQSAVYVGDNPRKDFLGARRAGTASVWLRLAGGEYTGLRPENAEYEPDLIASSWQELALLLLGD